MDDAFVQPFGFSNAAEFHTLVCRVDISTPEKLRKLKKWQLEDGTKHGLISLEKMELAGG